MTTLIVKKLLPKIVAWCGPVFFRLCRNKVSPIFSDAYEPEIGKGITLCEGTDVTIICCGVMVERSALATQQLAAQNIRARVVELHTVKPLDAELVLQGARETGQSSRLKNTASSADWAARLPKSSPNVHPFRWNALALPIPLPKVDLTKN